MSCETLQLVGTVRETLALGAEVLQVLRFSATVPSSAQLSGSVSSVLVSGVVVEAAQLTGKCRQP